MEHLKTFYYSLKEILSVSIFTLGESHITLWSVLYLVVLAFLLIYVSGKIKVWIAERLLSRTSLHIGVRLAAGTVTRYIVVTIGLFIILQTAGIDLTMLNIIAGAVGIGVGFGLQNIASNFISGLIIMFERPIKLGDRIVVGEVEGDVVHIGARSTSVVTNDNITMIIPNSKIISENVVNWSHNDDKVRFRIPVSVAYGSDVRLVERLLIEAAKEDKDVLSDPAPGVRLMEFGDNGLHFELRAWTDTLTHRKGLLISNLNFAIHDKFKEHNVEIPYPQRDIHIKSGNSPKGAE
jgi:small-conductance mechanosensitive channel